MDWRPSIGGLPAIRDPSDAGSCSCDETCGTFFCLKGCLRSRTLFSAANRPVCYWPAEGIDLALKKRAFSLFFFAACAIPGPFLGDMRRIEIEGQRRPVKCLFQERASP